MARIESPEITDFRLLAHRPMVSQRVNEWHHDVHELIYVVAGPYAVQLPGVHWQCTPGDVLCYPAGMAHRGRLSCADPTVFYLVQWQPAANEEWPRTPCRVHDADGRLLTLLDWMEQLTPPGDAQHVRRRDMMFSLFLQEYRALQAAPPSPPSPVARVKRAMEVDYASRTRDLHFFCELVGLTPNQLCRRFKAETNMSPMRYLRMLRVRAAVRLLRQTDHTLREIADEVGFYDVAHLCREIARSCGRRPTELRAEAAIAGTSEEFR